MRGPFLTLFTPTYNRAHTLHRVYESILAQTLLKRDGEYLFEWIVVDDGSTDGTDMLIKRWRQESGLPIRYFYQENRGKPHASRKGIEEARGELFLFCDSDDEFLPETFETFHRQWMAFDEEEKHKCGGIGVLCQDQHGRRLGCDYPVEREMVPSLEVVLKWRDIGLGETWAALKTDNLKKAFTIPEEAASLRFIPESFFWSRIVFELQPCSYMLNKVLRIYHRNEEDSVSRDVRSRFPEGFLFESRWFVTRYWRHAWRCPGLYAKHLLKILYYAPKVQRI